MKNAKRQEMIDRRTINTAKYMIDNCCTVRDVAKHFGISKSCIHTNFSNRLKDLSYTTYEEVQFIMAANKEERTIRGGQSTKNKFSNLLTTNKVI